ncbi:hypothetical protein HS3_01942 [Bacillus subtilis]|nr:hypothetical protein HS3_01942 [Bacillus subtilis]
MFEQNPIHLLDENRVFDVFPFYLFPSLRAQLSCISILAMTPNYIIETNR